MNTFVAEHAQRPERTDAESPVYRLRVIANGDPFDREIQTLVAVGAEAIAAADLDPYHELEWSWQLQIRYRAEQVYLVDGLRARRRRL